METFFQVFGVVGALASIIGILLYIRGQETKLNELRRDIVRTLSFQIGEGRNLSRFEIQMVIFSKTRGIKVKLSSITVDEIIEDLVTDTISSPMLDAERKKEILDEI
jgi:hypothetical protein